uniref:Ribosomal RNA processing 1B n=1 Tax=Otolemur garnettii TaxID=30611 RepID=H0X1G0_OTOGA
PAMQPAEIQFAQRLASNEKGIRDRAVKKLRQYISVKTQRETGGFSQEELLKIWKGLFHCMWVQDEPLLQEELANTIAQLVHVVNNSEAQHLFIQTFWQTMNREWKGIDRLRLDKYYMLIRLVLRQSFEVLKRDGWEESRIKLFLDVLMKEILCPESQSPNAVRFHFIDIYLDELSKVGGKELLADQNLKFIDPFCKIAAKTKDQTLVQTIARGVFEAIVDQSPFVPEETVEEQKTKEEAAENETACRKAASRKKAAIKEIQSQPDMDTGPLLQFDYKAVADRLLEITNRKNIPPFNRKRLSKLIRKFQDLSEGSISQLNFAEDISADEEDQTLSEGIHKKKLSELKEKANLGKEKEEEGSGGNIQKRKRKKKKKNHPQPENSGPSNEVPSLEQNGGTSSTGEESSSEHLHSAPMHSKRKRPRDRCTEAQEEGRGSNQTSAPAEPGCQPADGKVNYQMGFERQSARHTGISLTTKIWGHGREVRHCCVILLSERALCKPKGSSGTLSPLKKQQLRTENNFVKFDTPFLLKPLFFRKSKSNTATCSQGPAVQNKTPSSSKKVTFGLNRNMTAEFKKTDKSLLVSPTGLSRVAFNPAQKPLHGVLKTPPSSPASTPLVAKKP